MQWVLLPLALRLWSQHSAESQRQLAGEEGRGCYQGLLSMNIIGFLFVFFNERVFVIVMSFNYT